MSEVLITSIEVLEDGKVRTIDNRNIILDLQPVIVIDSKLENEQIEVKGSDLTEVRADITIKTIDGFPFSGSFSDLETALRELALKANRLLNGGSSGGGGSATSTDTLQQEQIKQQTPKEERFYFELSDVENKSNVPVFPLTCAITFNDLDTPLVETVPSATYASIDDLIIAANTLTLYALEKRTDTSFYVLDGSISVKSDSENFITLHTGLTFRVYRFYRLNKGSYPSTNLSNSDLILEQQKYINGTGLNQIIKVINPLNYTIYGAKSVTITFVAAIDEEINIKTLDGSFSSGVNLPLTLPKGQYIAEYKRVFDRPSKNPIVIDNTGGDINNYVIIDVNY